MARFEGQSAWKVSQRIRDNELLLPNVQRPLVWEPAQVEKLFDSLYQGFPVGTALIWRTRQVIDCRRFIVNFDENVSFYGDPWSVPTTGWKEYVLDGQQRMQSIYIAFHGTYQDDALHLVLPSPSAQVPQFRFAKPGRLPASALAWPLRDVVKPGDQYKVADRLIDEAMVNRPAASEARAALRTILVTCNQRFLTEETIFWFKADEDENEVFKDFNNVVEVFIRVNDGGTKLSRSDLVFTLTKAQWPESARRFEDFVEDLNDKAPLGFDIDELLKAGLLLTDQEPNVTPETMKKRDVVARLKQEWSAIERTMRRTIDFLIGPAQIRSTRVLPSLNAVLPIAWFIHHTDEPAWGEHNQVEARRWLYRSLLERIFGLNSTRQVKVAVEVLRKSVGKGERTFPYVALCRAFDLRPEGIDEYRMDIGRRSLSESILPLFLAYLDAGLTLPHLDPIWEGNLPHVDHIIPKSTLRKMCDAAGEPEPLKIINNIGNYRVLGQVKNISKSNKWLDAVYGAEEWESVRRADLLPDLPFDLRQPVTLAQYRTFVEARRGLLLARLNSLFRFVDEDTRFAWMSAVDSPVPRVSFWKE